MAKLATVSRALALDPSEEGGIKRISLSTVAPLAGAANFTFLLGRLFHAIGRGEET